MTSVLEEQLKRHRTDNRIAPVGKRVSFLFDSKDVVRCNDVFVIKIGLAGFKELLETYPSLIEFSHLFSGSKSKKEFMSPEEARAHTDSVDSFLIRVSPVFMSEICQACVEYLIQMHDANTHNASALILMSLPFHETPQFGRLIRAIPLLRNDVSAVESGLSQWGFLDKAAKAASPITRGMLVKLCIKDSSGFLQMLIDHASKSMRAGVENVPLLNFMSGLVLEVISAPVAASSRNHFLHVLVPLIHLSFKKRRVQSLEFFYFGLSLQTALMTLRDGQFDANERSIFGGLLGQATKRGPALAQIDGCVVADLLTAISLFAGLYPCEESSHIALLQRLVEELQLTPETIAESLQLKAGDQPETVKLFIKVVASVFTGELAEMGAAVESLLLSDRKRKRIDE